MDNEQYESYVRWLINDANQRIRFAGAYGFVLGLLSGLGAFLFLN